jgi:hypothetical protein
LTGTVAWHERGTADARAMTLNLGGMARGVGLIGPLVSCQTDRTVPTDRVRK